MYVCICACDILSLLISLNNIEILESFKVVLKEHYFINHLQLDESIIMYIYVCMYVCMFIGMNEQVRRRKWADVRPISEVGPGRHALMGSYIIEYIHTRRLFLT